MTITVSLAIAAIVARFAGKAQLAGVAALAVAIGGGGVVNAKRILSSPFIAAPARFSGRRGGWEHRI